MNGIHFLKSVKSIVSRLPEDPAPGDRYLVDSKPHQNFVVEYVDGEWVRDSLYPFSGVLVEDQDAAFTYSKHSSHKFKWFKSATVNTLAKIYGTPYSVHQMTEALNLSKGLCVEDGRISLNLSKLSCLEYIDPDKETASLGVGLNEDHFISLNGKLHLKKYYVEMREHINSKKALLGLFDKELEARKAADYAVYERITLLESDINKKLNELLLGHRRFTYEEYVDDQDMVGLELPATLQIWKDFDRITKLPQLGGYLKVTVDGEELVFGELFSNPDADFSLQRTSEGLRITFHKDFELGNLLTITGITNTF